MALFGLGKKGKTVGLDVGSGLLKLAVIEHSRGEPELSRVAVQPLMADAIVEGEIMDPGVVADAIRSLLETAGVKDKRVVVAVGGRDVIIKKIQVDRMKEADAYEVVRWEAQQHVPFDIEGVELDFQILDPEADGVQMEVLLVAAKRELVANRLAILSEAGLEPSIVDVDAFALHNAFDAEQPGVPRVQRPHHRQDRVGAGQDPWDAYFDMPRRRRRVDGAVEHGRGTLHRGAPRGDGVPPLVQPGQRRLQQYPPTPAR